MCTVDVRLGCEGPGIAGQCTGSRGQPGDVNTAADADAMRERTGCDGVMVARAAMRKTGVTPERIETYQRKMASAMEVASSHADEVEIVDVTFDDAPLPGTMHGTEAGSITAVAY